MERISTNRVAAIPFFFFLMATVGCAGSVSKQTQLMKSQGNVEITASELRYQLYEFVYSFVGAVDLAADEILRESDDPGIRQRALIWKIAAVPAIEQAAFEPDAMTAVADV
jgi:hypothetical protein